MLKECFLQRTPLQKTPKNNGSKPKGQQGPELDRRRHNRRPAPKQNGRRPRKGH